MTPLVSTDPKDILAAANCFISCVPIGYNDPLKSYLLTNAAGAATGPCVTPSAPTIVSFGSPTDTTLTLVWVQGANVGSIIFSYTVKLGTAPGGPYTITRTTRVGTKHLVITGLTAGMTYYAVVVANSFSGCSSANSAEASATTTGTSLATGLLGYWKLDESGSPVTPPWVDATGNGWNATACSGNGPNSIAGLINNGSNINGGNLSLKVSTGIDVRATTTPFTATCWIKWNGGGNQGYAIIGEAHPVAGGTDWLVMMSNSPNGSVFAIANPTGSSPDTSLLTGIVLSQVNFNFILFGYDGTNVFLSVNDSARVTQARSSVRRGSLPLGFGGYDDCTFGCPGVYDEIAYWNRALSTSEGTQLFNSGAGLRPPGI